MYTVQPPGWERSGFDGWVCSAGEVTVTFDGVLKMCCSASCLTCLLEGTLSKGPTHSATWRPCSAQTEKREECSKRREEARRHNKSLAESRMYDVCMLMSLYPVQGNLVCVCVLSRRFCTHILRLAFCVSSLLVTHALNTRLCLPLPLRCASLNRPASLA